MKIRIFTILTLLFITSLKGYGTMALTIGQVEACPGQEVLVPVTGSDFIDVAAMTFYIGYDPEVVEFVTIENIHPSLESALVFNGMTQPEVQIGISWSGINGISFTDIYLFDIRFSYSGGSGELPFNPGYEFVRSDLTVIADVILNPGFVQPSVLILSQPANTNVVEGSSADFTIETNNDLQYTWMGNNGNGWDYLTEGDIYTGVHTPHLKIYNVPLTLDSAWFRCELNKNGCMVLSDSALLTVDSSTSVVDDFSPESLTMTYIHSPGYSGLDLEVFEPCNMRAELFGTNGVLLQKLFSGNLSPGSHFIVIPENQLPEEIKVLVITVFASGKCKRVSLKW